MNENLHDLDDVAAEFGIELANDEEVARVAAANAVRWAGVLRILADS